MRVLLTQSTIIQCTHTYAKSNLFAYAVGDAPHSQRGYLSIDIDVSELQVNQCSSHHPMQYASDSDADRMYHPAHTFASQLPAPLPPPPAASSSTTYDPSPSAALAADPHTPPLLSTPTLATQLLDSSTSSMSLSPSASMIINSPHQSGDAAAALAAAISRDASHALLLATDGALNQVDAFHGSHKCHATSMQASLR